MSVASVTEVLQPSFNEKPEIGRLSSTPINQDRTNSRVGSALSGVLTTRDDAALEEPPSDSRNSLASGYEQELAALNIESDRASNTPTSLVRKGADSSGNLTPTAPDKNVTKPFSSHLHEGSAPLTPTQKSDEVQDIQSQNGRVNSTIHEREPSFKDGDFYATSNPRPFSSQLSASQKPVDDNPVPPRDYAFTPQRSSAQSLQNGKADNVVTSSRASNLSRQNEPQYNGDPIDSHSRNPSADYRISEPPVSRNSQRLDELSREKTSSLSTNQSNNSSQVRYERKNIESPADNDKNSTISGFHKGSDRGISPSPTLSRQSNRVSFHDNGMGQQGEYGVRPPSGTSTRQSSTGGGGIDVKHHSPTNESSPSVSSHASRRTYDLQKALQMDELEVKNEQLKKLIAERDRQIRQQAEQISSLERELAAEKERSKNTSSTPSNHPKESSSSHSPDQVVELERRIDQLLMERENLITELNETKKELGAAHNRVNAPTESSSTKQGSVEDGKSSSNAENGIGLRNFDPNHPSALKRRIGELESQLQDLQEAHHSLLSHESSLGAPVFEQMSSMNTPNNHLLQELRRENCLLKEEIEHFKKTYSPHVGMPSHASGHSLLDGSLRQELDDLKRDMHVMRDRSEQLAAENLRLRDQMKVQDKPIAKGSPGYDNTLSHYRMERNRVLDDVNRLKREISTHGSGTRYASTTYSANFNGTSKSKSLANLVCEEDAEFDQHASIHMNRAGIYKAPNPKDYASPYEEARSAYQAAGGASNATRLYNSGPHRISHASPNAGVDRMATSAYSTMNKYNNKYATTNTASSYLSERTSVLAVDPTHRRYGNGTGDHHNNWDRGDEEDDGDLTSALLDENVDDLLMKTSKLSPSTTPKRHGSKHRHRRHHHNSSNPHKASRQRNGSISGDTASILSDADRELKEFPYSSAAISGTETITSRNTGFLRSEMRHPPGISNVNASNTTYGESSHLRSFPSGPVRMSPQSRPHFTDHHGGMFPSSRETSGNLLHTSPPHLITESSRFTTIGKHPFAPRSAADISIGDVVKFSRNAGRISNGLVHYIGPLPGRNDMYLGVELDMEEGKHDGIYEGRRYFQCKRNKGVFVAFNKVIMSYGHTEK